MISTDTKLDQLSFIKKQISLPKHDYLEVKDFIRITYFLYGMERHLLLSTPEEAAEYFIKHNSNIKCFDYQDGELMISVNTLEVYAGYNGEPVQREGIDWFSWSDLIKNYKNPQFYIHLDRNECLNICAHLEWEKIQSVFNVRRA